MASDLVPAAIAKEEALERVAKTAQRRELARTDHAKNMASIDLKLGGAITGGFKVGLTASQIARECGLSVPRVYQLRNLYREHIDQEHAHG